MLILIVIFTVEKYGYVYCFDVMKNKLYRNKKRMTKECKHAEFESIVYDDINRIFYTLNVSNKEQTMFKLHKIVPNAFWVEEIVNGFIKSIENRSTLFIPTNITNLVIKFC